MKSRRDVTFRNINTICLYGIRREELQRPRDEMAELYKMRANTRVDLKRFQEAKIDYDKVCMCTSTGLCFYCMFYCISVSCSWVCFQVIGMMDSDGEKADGTARYLEYPDAFVQVLSYQPMPALVSHSCPLCPKQTTFAHVSNQIPSTKLSPTHAIRAMLSRDCSHRHIIATY